LKVLLSLIRSKGLHKNNLTFFHPIKNVVEIEVHLSGVGMGEFAHLQVDDHQTPQATMEKDQVHPIPFVTDAQTLPWFSEPCHSYIKY